MVTPLSLHNHVLPRKSIPRVDYQTDREKLASYFHFYALNPNPLFLYRKKTRYQAGLITGLKLFRISWHYQARQLQATYHKDEQQYHNARARCSHNAPQCYDYGIHPLLIYPFSRRIIDIYKTAI